MVWRDQKRIPLVGSKTRLTCSGRQTTRSQGRRDRAENGNLRKLGMIYRLGTVFAPRQDLYQKGARGMERPEMYYFSWCNNPSYLWGSQTTLSEGTRYRGENGNLCKLGRIYHLDTVFAPRQYLNQKRAMGMKRPEMYSFSRCMNRSYLCGPSNYPVSRQAV